MKQGFSVAGARESGFWNVLLSTVGTLILKSCSLKVWSEILQHGYHLQAVGNAESQARHRTCLRIIDMKAWTALPKITVQYSLTQRGVY